MPHYNCIQEVIGIIQKEPSIWWSVDQLARKVHLSISQFTRRFRAATHTSPKHFVIQSRLERAQQLIRETEMSLGLSWQQLLAFLPE